MPTVVPISSIHRHACIDMYSTLKMVALFPTATGLSRLRSLETMRYIWGFLPSRYPNSWMVYNRKSENNMDDFGVPWCTPLLGKLHVHSLSFFRIKETSVELGGPIWISIIYHLQMLTHIMSQLYPTTTQS